MSYVPGKGIVIHSDARRIWFSHWSDVVTWDSESKSLLPDDLQKWQQTPPLIKCTTCLSAVRCKAFQGVGKAFTLGAWWQVHLHLYNCISLRQFLKRVRDNVEIKRFKADIERDDTQDRQRGKCIVMQKNTPPWWARACGTKHKWQRDVIGRGAPHRKISVLSVNKT